MTITGKKLNEKYKLGAAHALYREDGRWYNHLERFPGILCDKSGYLTFNSLAEYRNSPHLMHGVRLNVKKPGIAGIPGYKFFPEIKPH